MLLLTVIKCTVSEAAMRHMVGEKAKEVCEIDKQKSSVADAYISGL